MKTVQLFKDDFIHAALFNAFILIVIILAILFSLMYFYLSNAAEKNEYIYQTKYAEDFSKAVVANTINGLIVRSEPSITSKYVKTLTNGTMVYSRKLAGENWAELCIDKNNLIGYVPVRFLNKM